MFKIGQKVICIRPTCDLIKDKIYTVVYSDWYGINVNGATCKEGDIAFLEDLLDMHKVSRSIGNDTKPTLRIMTPEQKENYSVPCHLCKYKNSDYESKECQKCIEDDISDQYYG